MELFKTNGNFPNRVDGWGAWLGSGTWRTPRVSAPEGPAAKLRANAPTRAARAWSPSAVQLTGGRRGWAPAADPTRAVDHAEPSGPRGGLRPLLSLKTTALRGKAGRGWSRKSGPREVSAAAGSGSRTAGPSEPVGHWGRGSVSLELLIGGQRGGTTDFPVILGHCRPLSVGIGQVRESDHGRRGTVGEEVGAPCGGRLGHGCGARLNLAGGASPDSGS
ncbi:hypothetical protein NDU88_000284 [Pleurodeles waltl]|uniref:Uncharacterized protein n=1 Tax=Pleurodeles waltl TaxID=8319 RepID=A0AAV7S447_PLEWA|nr:hypothetical protein NDU88_000284 [Pleurodeles waltl]